MIKTDHCYCLQCGDPGEGTFKIIIWTQGLDSLSGQTCILYIFIYFVYIHNRIVDFGISVMAIDNSYIMIRLHKSRKDIIHSQIPFAQIMIHNDIYVYICIYVDIYGYIWINVSKRHNLNEEILIL